MTQVKVTKDFYGWRIYLNGALHLYFPQDGDAHAGVESWMDTPACRYYIEWSSPTRTVRTEYEDRYTWLDILKQVDAFIGPND